MRLLLFFLFALAVLVLFISVPGQAGAKNIIKAYFNGREATVTGVTLKVGEPFTIGLDVTPDRDTTVIAILREPGGGDEAYRLLNGETKGNMVTKKCGPDSPAHFRWTLAPGGKWTYGNAPLDIQYDVWGKTPADDVQGYFTVVDAHISPERFRPAATPGPSVAIAITIATVFITAYAICRRK
jgi:sarcinarray family protein